MEELLVGRDNQKSTPQKSLNRNRGSHPKGETWNKATPAQSTRRKQVAQDTAQPSDPDGTEEVGKLCVVLASQKDPG